MSALSRIALVGLPASGKTTLAPLLAAKLGWRWADTDDEVASFTGSTPAEILQTRGEPALREAELSALRRLLDSPASVVIACGGGLPTNGAARRLLSDAATVVWLDAPDDQLIARLGDGAGRPLLAGDPARRLAELRASRAGAYQAAHMRMATDAPPGETAQRLSAMVSRAVRVDLAGRVYHVEVRPGALADIAEHLPAQSARVALVADRAVMDVARRVAASVRTTGREVTILGVSGGETAKTWAAAGRLLSRLGAAGIQRGDCLVAVGGGSVGDAAGFVAATHLRGIRWIGVPTTLLAMVDSAVGGKTGVNLPRGKNLAGAFWQPHAVLCDTEVLGTLPDRAYRSAFAEVVKYSMVVKDGLAALIDVSLEGLLRREAGLLTDAVTRCCAIKADIVTADEREAGSRAILNYGHTVGHALEAATGYDGSVMHGEAVAAGMRVAGKLSITQLGCAPADIAWQDELLARCGLGAAPPLAPARVMALIEGDKKRAGRRVGWVLLEARGAPCFGQVVPEPEVEARLAEVLRQ